MLKRILVTAFLLSVVIGIAWAGEAAKGAAPAMGKGTTKAAAGDKMAASKPAANKMMADKMAAMKDEMMKCAVCKTMAAHLDEFGPVMTTEVVHLNDGVAISHGVSDPAKVASFHAVCAEMSKAGMACQSMTPDQAKTQLCSFCQSMYTAMKAGAKMSQGETKMGNMMVLTSGDPAVKTQLDGIASKCELMASSM